MDRPVPPIFLVEGQDVGVFASVEDAQLQLEPFMVRQGQETAYDAKGRLLRLQTDGMRVNISLVSEEPTHANELGAILSQFLIGKNEPFACGPTRDLASLVDACRKFASSGHPGEGLLRKCWRWIKIRFGG